MVDVATREEMERLNRTANGRPIRNPRKWKAIVVCVGDPDLDEPQPWQERTAHNEQGEIIIEVCNELHKSIYYGGHDHIMLFPSV